MAYIKLNHYDIENCLLALEETEERTESEQQTLDKLRLIRLAQKQKKARSKEQGETPDAK